MDRFVSLAVAVTWHAKQKESREKRATHVLDFFSTFCRPISFCNPARIVPFFFRSNLLLYRAPFRAGNWFFFTSIEEYQLQKLTGLAVKKGFFRVSGEHFCSAYRQSDFCVFLPFSSVIWPHFDGFSWFSFYGRGAGVPFCKPLSLNRHLGYLICI